MRWGEGWGEVQQTEPWPRGVPTAPWMGQQEICTHAECSGLHSPAWGAVGSRSVGSGSTPVGNQAVRVHQLGRRAVGKRRKKAKEEEKGDEERERHVSFPAKNKVFIP